MVLIVPRRSQQDQSQTGKFVKQRPPADLDKFQSSRRESGAQRGNLQVVFKRIPPARAAARQGIGAGEEADAGQTASSA